jgi:hypothetical protein
MMKQSIIFMLAAALIFAECAAGAGEVPMPDKGMSPEQLIKVWYEIEFTRFARDYKNYNTFFLIDRNGARRERKAYRSRIALQRDGFDYKDFAVFLSPASIKGVAMLTWSYLDPEREREQWLYLPSMRKARRSSPAEDDENTLGTVLTVEEITSWRPEHEKYRLLGAQNFNGYTSIFDKQQYYRGEPCYVIEAVPKRKNAIRSKRTFWLRSYDGCCLLQEVYDQNGKLFKTIFRRFDEIGENRYPAIVLVEAQDLRTGEKTVIRCDKIIFDSGIDEAEFSIDYLQRMKW